MFHSHPQDSLMLEDDLATLVTRQTILSDIGPPESRPAFLQLNANKPYLAHEQKAKLATKDIIIVWSCWFIPLQDFIAAKSASTILKASEKRKTADARLCSIALSSNPKCQLAPVAQACKWETHWSSSPWLWKSNSLWIIVLVCGCWQNPLEESLGVYTHLKFCFQYCKFLSRAKTMTIIVAAVAALQSWVQQLQKLCAVHMKNLGVVETKLHCIFGLLCRLFLYFFAQKAATTCLKSSYPGRSATCLPKPAASQPWILCWLWKYFSELFVFFSAILATCFQWHWCNCRE